MKVKLKSAKLLVPRIEKELGRQQAENANLMAGNIKQALEDDLNKTLEHKGQSETRSFRDAYVHTEHRVERKRWAILHVRAVVNDDAGQAHYPWHVIAFGRPDRIQRRTSPVIKAYRSNRTFVNKLEVAPFSGYTGRTYVIRQGQRVRGVTGRKWYQITRDNFIKKNKRPGWDVRAKVIDPKYGEVK